MKFAKLAVLASGALFLSGCSQAEKDQLKRLGMPVAASDRTEHMLNVWIGAWIACLVVSIIVVGLILWAVIRYRRRADDEVPSQMRYHLPIEVLYTIAPVITVAVFFFHTVTNQNQMLAEVENPDHTVQVVGSKWQWTFNYLDETATEGEDVFDVGTPEKLPELYLPVGESVRFLLNSPDVIHSFWVPEFYFKLDVFPGKTNSFDLTPTREGTYTGRCAELCGVYHSRMLFKLHIVSPAEYEQHLKELQAKGQTGKPRGQDRAYEVAGLNADGDQ